MATIPRPTTLTKRNPQPHPRSQKKVATKNSFLKIVSEHAEKYGARLVGYDIDDELPPVPHDVPRLRDLLPPTRPTLRSLKPTGKRVTADDWSPDEDDSPSPVLIAPSPSPPPPPLSPEEDYDPMEGPSGLQASPLQHSPSSPPFDDFVLQLSPPTGEEEEEEDDFLLQLSPSTDDFLPLVVSPPPPPTLFTKRIDPKSSMYTKSC